MFLKSTFLLACVCTFAVPPALAQDWEDANFQISGQLGLDAWDIGATANTERLKRLLYMADSTPQWTYKSPAPWIRLETEATLNRSLSARFKFRADQSSGLRIDELNMNWAISPFLGLSAGVVDYKTSWCQTYNTESAWVRENDPFCTVRTTDQATGAAPGLQLTAQWSTQSVQWQAQTGVYNPLLLSYDTEEFNNRPLLFGSQVSKNKKAGASVSAVHLETGAEWRLSYLRTHQAADWRDGIDNNSFHKPQDVALWYAGLAWNIGPHLRARLTYLHSDMLSEYTRFVDYRVSYVRESSTAELLWRVSPKDLLVAGFSEYKTRDETLYRPAGSKISYKEFNVLQKFKNHSWSLAWRREWSPSMFTSVQWTQSAADEFTSYAPVKNRRARGEAIGIRLGWRF